jgi:hypothetical protein
VAHFVQFMENLGVYDSYRDKKVVKLSVRLHCAFIGVIILR